MHQFLPHYVNVDLDLPKEYHYKLGLFFDFLTYHIDWTNIKYKTAELDIEDIKLDFTRSYDTPLIKFDAPAVKYWEMNADQAVDTWFIPASSPIRLIIRDLDFDFNANLRLDDNGYLDPVIYDCDIKFGDSYLYHDNWMVAFVMH